jgi:hypothetical protein
LGPSMARSRNAATSAPERSRAVRRAITTISDCPDNPARECRNHSLIRRFTRLRTTALPTRLLTVTPNRCRFSVDFSVSELIFDAVTTTKLPKTRRFPDLTTRLKSWVRKMRSARRKRPVFESTDLLRGNASCEALAALRAAPLENRASRACLHSCAESMNSFPADTARLIGAFHRRPSILFFVLSEGGRGSGLSFPSDFRICRSVFGFSPSRASTLFSFVRKRVFLNTQGREPSDHLAFAPSTSSSRPNSPTRGLRPC